MAPMRPRGTLAIVLAAVLSGLAACQGDAATLAFERPDMQSAEASAMALRSPAFAHGQPIPERYGAYGEDVSPPLSWEPVEGAVSYALVMEDPDADRPAPYVHWVAWNIPATVTSLPEGLPGGPRLANPEGMRQGLNDRGSAAYFGPRPPAGTGVHHYHVQVFALDTLLDIDPRADRNALVGAMEGHVLGRGRLVGTYEATAAPRP
jgi:Raf kinase inhibitor-like YbhB/YbcL family protein